ncbi:helix-turn-helix domain-containing protein [Puniceibacterium confluentis]|uniref:helix-turn-helix domain-containing protein n=1 Tax=Puniceibacterium confluentis TaxID=1958944 RepID=UPI0011B6641C|nr:helix-turn-helix domain-containing protein [Puniceibacterium confluentis]
MSAALPIQTCRPSDAPAVFSVSRATIYRWAKAGYITIYKRTGISLIDVDEVKAYIKGTDN